MSDARQNGLMGEGHEIYTRRKGRNFALGGVLAGIVLMIFAVTIVKLSNGVEMKGFDHTFETTPGTVITE